MRSWIRELFTPPMTRTICKSPRRVRLAVEMPEDRLALATFTVNSPNDSGAGTLREAIASSFINGPGSDTVLISAATMDGRTISLSTFVNDVSAGSTMAGQSAFLSATAR